MEPYVFIDKNNISEQLCDTIINTNETIVPLYPEESNIWFAITNTLVDHLIYAIECFITKYSLYNYNILNIVQNTSFLQPNMEIYRTGDFAYHTDFFVTDKIYSTLSYLWCLSDDLIIIFNTTNSFSLKQGDLLLFPASWEYQYKFDSNGIYIKGTLYNSYE